MSILIGNQLRAAREAKELSLSEVSNALFIRITYIQALENGRGEIIPSPVQVRGFLRMYADYLGLDSDEIIKGWSADAESEKKTETDKKTESKADKADKKAKPPKQPTSPDFRKVTFPERQSILYSQPVPTNLPVTETNEPQAGTAVRYPNYPVGGNSAVRPYPPPNTSSPFSAIPLSGFPSAQRQNDSSGSVTPYSPSQSSYFPNRSEETGIYPSLSVHTVPSAETPNNDRPDETKTSIQMETVSETKKKKKKFSLFQKKDKLASSDSETQAQDPIRSIFLDIGTQLRTRRQALGLSLEDCESQTLIRLIYLNLMESGDLEQLPSFIQGRGMLNNYAAFLNLDVDDIMLKYAEALNLFSQDKARNALSASSKNKEKTHKPTKKAGKAKQFLTPDLFVGVFVIVGMAALLLYSAITITSYRNAISTPTVDLNQVFLEQLSAATDIPSFMPTPTATIDPEVLIENQEADTEENNEVMISDRPVQLFINAEQRTYLKVLSDGKEVFSGRTLPNNTYPFDGENLIEVITGNADAISITYNQKNLGKLGNKGEVMQIDFSPISYATPTPQFSPTPTETLQPTYTPQPETPLPTNTPTPYIP